MTTISLSLSLSLSSHLTSSLNLKGEGLQRSAHRHVDPPSSLSERLTTLPALLLFSVRLICVTGSLISNHDHTESAV